MTGRHNRPPRMLQSNQIEAHLNRLTAVQNNLRGYPDDGRAVEAVSILEVAIGVIGSEAFMVTNEVNDVEAPAIVRGIDHDEDDAVSEHDWRDHTHEDDSEPVPHKHSVSEDVAPEEEPAVGFDSGNRDEVTEPPSPEEEPDNPDETPGTDPSDDQVEASQMEHQAGI